MGFARTRLHTQLPVVRRVMLDVVRSRWPQMSAGMVVYLALQAVSIWLDQYATLTDDGELFTGVNYTDDNAVIPGRMIGA